MFWRLVDDGPQHAFFNMACDEAISESVRKKFSPPTLRLYQWIEPSVSIGYFQNVSVLNLAYCNEKGYSFVRRSTGGKAILHNDELTYSFSSRNDLDPFKGGLQRNYLALGNALLLALKNINLDAQITLSKKYNGYKSPFCFHASSYGEIAVNGKKIIGSAQKRYNNGFLQQGSILLDSDAGELDRILRHEKNMEDSCEIGAIRKYLPLCSIERLKEALRKAFENTFEIILLPASPTDFELRLAEKLEKEKYSRREWNFAR